MYRFTRRLGPRIAVVLGGGVFEDGSPSQNTRLRSQAAIRLARAQPDLTFILSGCGPPDGTGTRRYTEAEVMRRLLIAGGVSPRRLWIEDQSIDTIGNAILVSARFLETKTPRQVYVVTSPFHMQRALEIFASVLGPSWPLEAYACEPGDDDAERAKNEPPGREAVRRFFSTVQPGDIGGAVRQLLRDGKPYYRSLRWLRRKARPSRRAA